jgi:hypothetical protein
VEIKNARDLAQAFKQGQFSSVGSYPLFFVTHDGEALSWKAVRENYRQIVSAVREGSNDGWRVVAHDVNWEDPALFCADSGERIPSAYAEPEE